MALNPIEEEDEYGQTIIVEREELMVPSKGDEFPTLRVAHFLKPLLNPQNQPLPKPPSVSLSSNPNIIHKLTKMVAFRGRMRPLKTWETWVGNLEQTHQNIWKKVGIFDAIRASTYKINRHNELIVGLAQKWCPETNTFVFPWGECTVTLEDVMILGGFSVLGVSAICSSESREFTEIEAKLLDACCDIKAKCRLLTHYGWMNHFKGKGSELEHVGFLVLWLSRYVFPNLYGMINQNVFGIAISFAKGIKFALAPAVLASLYRDLTLLKEKFATFTSNGRTHDLDQLVLWAPFQLVQLWAWERFPRFRPEPVSLIHGEPRLARWHNVKRLVIVRLGEELEVAGDQFLWKPYTLPLENWDFPKFYSENGRWVLIDSEVDDELLSFVRCIRACELVGMYCLEKYLPHRVSMQFGMDQDIPAYSLPQFNGDFQLAWNYYDKPVTGWRLYLPPRLAKGHVTFRYSNWWKKELLAPHDHLLFVYERKKRQRRTSQKAEKLGLILDANLEGDVGNKTPLSSPSNEAMALDFVGGKTEITRIENPLSLGGDIGNGSPLCLPSNEAMALDHIGSKTELTLVKISPSLGGDVGNKTPLYSPSSEAKDFVGSKTGFKLIENSPYCENVLGNGNQPDRKESPMAKNEALLLDKGKHIALEEEGQKTQDVTPPNLVIIDDDDEEKNDRVSQFLSLVSSIEERVRILRRNFSMLQRS